MTSLGQPAVHAASFEVTNLDDAGPGSLRDAIVAANGSPGADVITFAPDVAGTILLGSGQLTITDSVLIVGPGPKALTIDGNAAGRVFEIPLSPDAVAVSISGVTISNGVANSGGGILVQDESLTLDDVALIDNTALGNGGGLFADGFSMTLTVRNSTISGNIARAGGGVYVEDTGGVTTFDGVVVDGNTASEKGGGIYLYDPDTHVVIDDSTITNNAAGKGGGIYLYSQDAGSLTISNSTISGNEATTGGGVYLYDIDHPVLISGSTISGNTATNGAGINIDRISAAATISNSTISGNTATGVGGGVRLARGGGLTIAHSTITENEAADAGGAWFPGSVTLSHVIVAGNTAATTADLHAAGGVTTDFSIIGEMLGAVTDGGGNQLGVTDPLLAPLADNEGPTLTHLPLITSPAIDTGNPAVAAPANDQRGLPRVDGIIDIGAVEARSSTIEFASASVTVAENAGTAAVTVTRTGTGDFPATVEIATADDTAIAPGDYGSVSTQLTWAARETGTKTIDIPVVLDGEHEADETFSVTLTSPTGATLGSSTSLAVTLQNSNTAPTIVDITDVTTPLGTAVPSIEVSIGDAEQPASALIVTATSSNQDVVADGGIAISGSGTTRLIDLAPLATGVATITVTVSDGSLTTTDTFTVTVNAPVTSSVAFVGSTGGRGAGGDRGIIRRLRSQGYDVTVIDDNTITGPDVLAGYDLVVMSSSVVPTRIGTKLADLTVPVVTWEGFLFDELRLSARGGESVGTSQDITITAPANPVAAQQVGTVSILTAPTKLSRAVQLAPGVIRVGDGLGNASLFMADTGAALTSGVAPARRVGLPWTYKSPDLSTEAGLAIFDAAITWALGDNPMP